MKEQKIYGLSNVHIAKLTENDGAITYGTPFNIPGAENLALDPEGDTSTFYADNRPYFKKTAKTGYSGNIEMADIPEKFLTEILGQTKDANGAIIENANDIEARFALMCEVMGDPSKRRVVFYDCLATRPAIEYSTNQEGIEVKTVTMDISIIPRSTDSAVKATLDFTEETATAYNSFFASVYEKDATAGV